MEAVHEGLHENDSVPPRRPVHLIALRGRRAQRFLAENVLFGVRRFDRPLAMEAIGQAYVDGVDVLRLEEPLVASVGLRDVELGSEGVRSLAMAARPPRATAAPRVP